MPSFTRWLELQVVADNTRVLSSLQLCQEKPSVCECVHCVRMYTNVCVHEHMCLG